jgi:carbonic anhydrase
MGLPVLPRVVLTQSPFAVVVSCADARVNVERLFGQSFNSMFIVRIAGNVLGTECLGSVDYALKHLAESLKLVVVLGHSQCGVVTAAVDSYLTPHDFGEIAFTHPLRSLVDRMQIAVRISATTLQSQFGNDVSEHPNYRAADVEASGFMNAAVTSFDLAREVENLHIAGMKVV